MAGHVLLWFRNDLRVSDNPALRAALATGGKVTGIHVDETDAALRRRGAASRWWLHHSLGALARELAALGIGFETRTSAAETSLRDAMTDFRADAIFWNRRYGPAERDLDSAIKSNLRKDGLNVQSHPGDALIEPFDIATGDGRPYAVFTPFWRALRSREIARPLAAPTQADSPISPGRPDGGYAPPAWSRKFETYWKIGEAAAQARLVDFLDDQIAGYPEDRNFPARDATSRLSPHLALGEISPRQIWHAALTVAQAEPSKAPAVEAFLRELAWRDFNIHQLYHRPDIANVPMQEKFADLRWRVAPTDLAAWQHGETGIPLVDAGMRELWETGFMHNRVRMVVASLLAKNLLLDWRLGERWFWDTLLDADPANNPTNWQWVAGSGLDAAPYFRIFNPMTQADTFDPEGAYVRRWAPEPRQPIVDLKASRERALAAFKAL